MTTIYLQFAKTKALKVTVNTATKFEAVLKDNMGKFKAVVYRNADNTVDVLFAGTPARYRLALEFAQWEFSPIWADLEAQGHKVLALT